MTLLVTIGVLGALGVAFVTAPKTGEAWRDGQRAGPVALVGSSGALLTSAACYAWEAMRLAALRDGITLVCNSSHRSQAKQTELRAAFDRAMFVWGANGGRAPMPPPVAKPGHSNHQQAIAIDIGDTKDPKVRAWLERNAARFGFKSTVPSEPWHYEYRP